MVSTYQTNNPPANLPQDDQHDRVAWTKGGSNRDVAELLGVSPVRITGDLAASCIDNRIELLVTKRFPRNDLVATVIPVGFDAGAITSVAVAVGDGPHSPRAVAIGEIVAASLGVQGTVITAYATDDEVEAAQQRLDRLTAEGSTFDTVAIQTPDPRSITEHLSRETLLVHGVAGGSFIDRHFTGTGNRLTSRARGCVLVVRDAPRRCFQVMVSPTGFALAPEMLIGDALAVMSYPFAPVVAAHRLLGIVRISTLAEVEPGEAIEQHIETVPACDRCDPTQAIITQREQLGTGPLPVVDDAGNLVGVILT